MTGSSVMMHAVGDNFPPLDKIARSIRDELDRCNRSDADWISAMTSACMLLHSVREHFGNHDRDFGKWLKEQEDQGVLNIHHVDRGAMINLGSDPHRCRLAFANSKSRSPRQVWKEAKPDWTACLPTVGKHRKKETKPKRKTATTIRRELKLGDDYERLHGTSLGSPKEMDVLIDIKDQTPDLAGELIERAVAGEAVTASAVYARKAFMKAPTIEEMKDIFVKHSQALLSAWQRSDPETKRAFIAFMEELAHGK